MWTPMSAAIGNSCSQNLRQIFGGHDALRIDPVANGEEIRHTGILAREVCGSAGVELSPVRPTTGVVRKCSYGVEPAGVSGARTRRCGDIYGVPAVGGGQPHVVGRCETDFDREGDPPRSSLGKLAKSSQRRDGRFTR